MGEGEELRRNKTILAMTRLRFTPEVQPIRETAVDQMLLQVFTLTQENLNINDIQALFRKQSGGYTIILPLLKRSLKRLLEKGSLEEVEDNGREKSYTLSKECCEEISKIQEDAKRSLDTVTNRLFKNISKGKSRYKAAFLECLCNIFSRLGAENIDAIIRKESEKEFFKSISLSSLTKKMTEEFKLDDSSALYDALKVFFNKMDPEYNTIKWSMGQSFFLMKTFGFGYDILPLFEKKFRNAIFYLDTNVLIGALEPRHIFHNTFKGIHQACKLLNIQFKVCEISLDELYTFLNYQRKLLNKVKDQIPKELTEDISSAFYKAYVEEQEKGEGEVDLDKIFMNVDTPRHQLEERFDVEIESDPWFIKARKTKEVENFVENLIQKYANSTPFGKEKSRYKAIHDALLLLWVKKQRDENDGNVWLITADSSLPGSFSDLPETKLSSLAIIQDALLQWIAPLGVQEEYQRDYASLFSEVIKRRLLPQKRILNLEDFLIFHKLDMQCKNLPAKDVKECLKYLQNNFPNLDTTDPADREKLAHALSKFFATPDREYKNEIQRLEDKNIELEQELEDKGHKIDELERDLNELKHSREQEKIVKSAKLRLGFVGLFFLMSVGAVSFLASIFGKGENLFQKMLSAWPFFSIPAVLSIVASWLFVGKEKLMALGWPFNKLFKVD